MWLSVFVFALLAILGCRPERLHSHRYSIPPTLVSILIRCYVAFVAVNGNENHPHFMWVLVMSGFAGTGLDFGGVEADPPDPNLWPPLGGSSSSSGGGVKPPNPPDKSNTAWTATLPWINRQPIINEVNISLIAKFKS